MVTPHAISWDVTTRMASFPFLAEAQNVVIPIVLILPQKMFTLLREITEGQTPNLRQNGHPHTT